MLKQFFIGSLMLGCLLNGSLYAQECDDKQPSVTPNSRYQLLNAGQEVKDLKTGLIWQRCLAGEHWNGRQCTGEIQVLSHAQIQAYISTHAKNWRLPTINELLTLDSGCWQSAINTHIFPPNPERYSSKDILRSSTPYTPSQSEARSIQNYHYGDLKWYWAFETSYGQKSYETIGLPMRLVRK